MRVVKPSYNFYPRSPCGERHSNFTQKKHPLTISIHALLAESDANSQQEKNNGHEFLSTLSLRRATVHFDNYNLHCVISIHALLAESDREPTALRTPHHIFLSTLSLRRATADKHVQQPTPPISIHALLAESDDNTHTYRVYCPAFLSTLSLRRATITTIIICTAWKFLSTLSLRRATDMKMRMIKASKNFYPRSPCGERPGVLYCHLIPSKDFYPRSPCGERQV